MFLPAVQYAGRILGPFYTADILLLHSSPLNCHVTNLHAQKLSKPLKKGVTLSSTEEETLKCLVHALLTLYFGSPEVGLQQRHLALESSSRYNNPLLHPGNMNKTSLKCPLDMFPSRQRLPFLVQQIVNSFCPCLKSPYLFFFFYFFQPFPVRWTMKCPISEKQGHFPYSYQVSGETIILCSIQAESHL